MPAKTLTQYPVHLGLGASAVSQPEFAGMDWYEAYGARHSADGSEGRLVSMFTFDSSWDSWEVHPQGSEVVLCTAGAMTLIITEFLDQALKHSEFKLRPAAAPASSTRGRPGRPSRPRSSAATPAACRTCHGTPRSTAVSPRSTMQEPM